jgi:hypothetical protein
VSGKFCCNYYIANGKIDYIFTIGKAFEKQKFIKGKSVRGFVDAVITIVQIVSGKDIYRCTISNS